VVDLFNQLGMGTAHYQFDSGGTLVVDGPVSRPTGVVAVVGGIGAFSGATGELTGWQSAQQHRLSKPPHHFHTDVAAQVAAEFPAATLSISSAPNAS
jgi:hypothetical protein